MRQRSDVLRKVCESLALEVSNEQLQQVAEMTSGYVGADIDLLCRECAASVATGGARPSEMDWKKAMSRLN